MLLTFDYFTAVIIQVAILAVGRTSRRYHDDKPVTFAAAEPVWEIVSHTIAG